MSKKGCQLSPSIFKQCQLGNFTKLFFSTATFLIIPTNLSFELHATNSIFCCLFFGRVRELLINSEKRVLPMHLRKMHGDSYARCFQ